MKKNIIWIVQIGKQKGQELKKKQNFVYNKMKIVLE